MVILLYIKTQPITRAAEMIASTLWRTKYDSFKDYKISRKICEQDEFWSTCKLGLQKNNFFYYGFFTLFKN